MSFILRSSLLVGLAGLVPQVMMRDGVITEITLPANHFRVVPFA